MAPTCATGGGSDSSVGGTLARGKQACRDGGSWRRASMRPQPSRRSTTPRSPLRFRGGLVFKAHILVYHSTLGLRVIKKKRRSDPPTLPSIDSATIPTALQRLVFYCRTTSVTMPRVSRSCEHFPDGSDLHLVPLRSTFNAKKAGLS